ncbi:MAG TPA: zf-HC2 domain-containing protein [Pyrinomonadaceae bacterium]|nr:zf-HC2 domain-containing protein [Pyrinomonadaceae bacterium]
MLAANTYNSICRTEDLAAYLEGELDVSACARLELHLQDCPRCVADLEVERRLLVELEFALADEPHLELPKNFAAIVAARAQSDMSGVRDSAERRRALRLCAVLAAISFALLGGATLSESVLAPLRGIWKAGTALFGFLGHVLYDAGAGVAVISRGVGGHLLSQSPRGLSLAVLILLALALFMLPRLIVRYHRARIVE